MDDQLILLENWKSCPERRIDLFDSVDQLRGRLNGLEQPHNMLHREHAQKAYPVPEGDYHPSCSLSRIIRGPYIVESATSPQFQLEEPRLHSTL